MGFSTLPLSQHYPPQSLQFATTFLPTKPPCDAHDGSLPVCPLHLHTLMLLRARSIQTGADVPQNGILSSATQNSALPESDGQFDAPNFSSREPPSTPPDTDDSSLASTPVETPTAISWPTFSNDVYARLECSGLKEISEPQAEFAIKGTNGDGLPLHTTLCTSDRPASPHYNPSILPSNPRSSSPRQPIYSIKSMLPRLLFLLLSLSSSFILIVYLVSTVPHLQLPTSVQVVRSQVVQLRNYASRSFSNYSHILLVLSVTFVWKQAFSIPGSALVNVLLGAIFGTYTATGLACVLTAVGSTVAYAMAKLARPVFETYMPKPLSIVQRALDGFLVSSATTGNVQQPKYDRGELASYLLVARLLPIVPYAALNVASGVLDLPLWPFFWTLVVGSAPYNYVTTSVGDLLSVASESEDIRSIWSASMLTKLLVVSMVGAIPVLFKGQLRSVIAMWLGDTSATSSEPDAYERPADLKNVSSLESPSASGSIRLTHSHSASTSTSRSRSSSSTWRRTIKRVSWKKVSQCLSGADLARILSTSTSPSPAGVCHQQQNYSQQYTSHMTSTDLPLRPSNRTCSVNQDRDLEAAK